MRLCVISNIFVEPFLLPLLRQSFQPDQVEVEFIDWADVNTTLEYTRGSDLVVVLPNLDARIPNWYLLAGTEKGLLDTLIHECQSVYQTLRNTVVCPIIWFGFEGDSNPQYHVCGLADALYRIIGEVNHQVSVMFEPGDAFLDIRHLLVSIGADNAYDVKNKYRWNQPYSQMMMQAIAQEINKQYRILYGKGKKCLVLDCDGVLWGGILAEDGIERIQLGNEGLGRQYQDFQRFLLGLYQHGVLLAVCSKNDLSAVQAVFRTHSGMVLQERHIVTFQVNWECKSLSIRRIAQTLGIALDSLAFVDDTEAELEAVRVELPEVLTVPYHRETVYKALSCFSLTSEMDLLRVEQRMDAYRSNRLRQDQCVCSETDKANLHSKKKSIDIHQAHLSEAARIAELSQRTNRCTNGKRYSVAEVIACMKNPSYELYSVYVSDQYSDLGLVGVFGLQETTLDLFALSCRALGCNIEKEMINMVREKHCTDGFFEDTGRNDALKQLLNGLLYLNR